MPPLPPDGGLLDDAYGSAWGMSGDGQVVTGLYWRPGQQDGLAHAFSWTQSTGVVDLGSSGGNSRANGADGDGSVIVGWDEHPVNGVWRPTVWVDGVLTTLNEAEGFTLAEAVNTDGTIIVGSSFDTVAQLAVATRWDLDGTTWNEQQLGALPGTVSGFGDVIGFGLSDDGRVIVGYNQFSFGNSTGFIWTEETGLVDVVDFLADNGIPIDPELDIQGLTAISSDGTTIVGSGQDTFFPFLSRSFIITLPPPCPGDSNGDGEVDVDDLTNVVLDWGTDGSGHGGDVDGSGIVDVDDLTLVILGWGPCP
jgi:probable HAF family extracellular repeat protein